MTVLLAPAMYHLLVVLLFAVSLVPDSYGTVVYNTTAPGQVATHGNGAKREDGMRLSP